MKHPGFQFRLAWLVWATLVASSGPALAQPTEKAATRSAARTKPQVIYHLPSSSHYAATLHAQAKGQNNNLPVESSTPVPPQISRETANADSPQERPEVSATPLEERRLKRPKPASNRSVRPQSVKTKGHGNSRAGNSHKK